MKKKTRQTGLLLSVLMLATTSLYPVSAFAEETTEAPAEAVTEAAEKSDAKTHDDRQLGSGHPGSVSSPSSTQTQTAGAMLYSTSTTHLLFLT